jgi:hypothetical protein
VGGETTEKGLEGKVWNESGGGSKDQVSIGRTTAIMTGDWVTEGRILQGKILRKFDLLYRLTRQHSHLSTRSYCVQWARLKRFGFWQVDEEYLSLETLVAATISTTL